MTNEKIAMAEYIECQNETDHVWSTDDCCIFTGGGVEIITGENPWEKFMALHGVKYTDEKTGRALMERYGGLARILTNMYGHSHTYGRYGDIAYSNFPDGSAVGICIGNVSIFRAEKGLVEIENKKCKFFKVR